MIKFFKKFLGFKDKPKKEEENELLKCPECKGTEWIEGPSGGSFGNIQCVKCNSKFNNMGIFGLNKIT